jgi:hypothetical protein
MQNLIGWLQSALPKSKSKFAENNWISYYQIKIRNRFRFRCIERTHTVKCAWSGSHDILIYSNQNLESTNINLNAQRFKLHLEKKIYKHKYQHQKIAKRSKID